MAEHPQWLGLPSTLPTQRRRVLSSLREEEQAYPLVLPGDPNLPVTHLAAWGLSHITGHRVSWRPVSSQPCLNIPTSVPPTEWTEEDETVAWREVADTVRKHARPHVADPRGWLRWTAEDGRHHPLAPRRFASTDTDFNQIAIDRDLALGKLHSEWVPSDARRLALAVGGNTRANMGGATPWDIMAQRRGDTIWTVALKTGRAVADRTTIQVAGGLSGKTTRDLTATATTTAMGWAPEGQIDAAIVWCAIWGLLATPVDVDGTLPNLVVEDGEERLRLPIPAQACTPEDVVDLIRSDASQRRRFPQPSARRMMPVPGVLAWVSWVRQPRAHKHDQVRLVRPELRFERRTDATDAESVPGRLEQLIRVERSRSAVDALDAERDRILQDLVDTGKVAAAMEVTGLSRAGVYRAADRARAATKAQAVPGDED